MPNASEGSLKNNYLYQGAFSELDADMGWTDFELRNYDAQIGRWMQMDPYDQFASGYLSMGMNPIMNIDGNGGFSAPGAVIGGLGGFVAGGIVALANGKNPVSGALIGTAAGVFLGGLLGDLDFGSSIKAVGRVSKELGPSLIIQGANTALNVSKFIRSSTTTQTTLSNRQLLETGGLTEAGDPLKSQAEDYIIKYWKRQFAYILIEGIGALNATSAIRGDIIVKHIHNGRFGFATARVSAFGTTMVSNFGHVSWAGSADLIADGKVIETKGFVWPKYDLALPTDVDFIGEAEFRLPVNAERVQIKVNAIYVYDEPGAGRAVPVPAVVSKTIDLK